MTLSMRVPGAGSALPPEGSGYFNHRLAVPLLVRRQGRPAVLIGYVLDQFGHRRWAEIIEHAQFVRPEEIEEDSSAVPLP